jgi:protein involved in polysaccharide export with SLBB domain
MKFPTPLILLTTLLAACAGAPPFDAKAVAMEWAAYMQRDYVLRVGDRLAVRVDELATAGAGAAGGETSGVVQDVIISPTGTVDLRRLPGPLHLAGRSVGAARTDILEAYKSVIPQPTVSVSLTEASAQSVYVCGEVGAPGAIAYRPGLTMTQAIATAGSFDITIKHSDVRILRISPDGSQRTFRVNMDQILHNDAPDFLLLPGDVVYAQTSAVADVGNLVELYIRRMLPFSLGGPALGTVQ